MFSSHFKKAYLVSLTNNFRSFYDDVCEYGNPKSANCIYFIHGLDGSAGQIRFALPAVSRFFNGDIYIKGLYTAEFSCRNRIWEKYTRTNLEKRVATIAADLTALAQQHKTVMVFCSSNGFYDFYAAASKLSAATKASLTLFWVACAPDRFEDTNWEKLFFKLNGFIHQDYRWVALPNSNYLRWFNPEVAYKQASKAQKPHKYFYKHDLESRFFKYGSLWSYFSIASFNDCLSHLIDHATDKLTIPTYVLAAKYDGYWQGKTVLDMQKIIAKYVEKPDILVRPTSHLWVAAPEHVYALLQTALGDEKLRT
jgi:pimeloyl-ACP methyl ester carboxylesterase